MRIYLLKRKDIIISMLYVIALRLYYRITIIYEGSLG